MEIKPKRGEENSSCSTLFPNILLKEQQQQQQQQKTLKCTVISKEKIQCMMNGWMEGKKERRKEGRGREEYQKEEERKGGKNVVCLHMEGKDLHCV